MDFPSNSHPKREPEPEKKIERVTTSEVVRRKKPLGRRISDIFTQADAGSVWSFVVMDVLVPAAKDMLSEAVSQGVDQMLFGNNANRGGHRSRGRNTGNGYINYGGMSSGSSRPSQRSQPSQGISRRGRATHNFDEIIIPTRVEAEEVVDRLFDLVARFDLATVSDLYDLVGITSNYADENWGWTDLRGAGVSRVKGGYLLDLPRPEQIK